jgi:hypothetical protein
MKILNAITAGFVLLLVLLSSGLFSQNKAVSIQGTLQDASGGAIDDGTQEVTFRLYHVPDGGVKLWEEVAPVAVLGGIYRHHLGSVTAFNDTIFNAPVYLGVEVDGLELSPRTEMTYAPYAISVNTAQTAQRIAQRGCSGQVGDIKYSIWPPAEFARENGDCWVPMDGRDITGSYLATHGGPNVAPDMSGMFLRATEYSGDNDPERGNNAAYSVQGDENKGHLHPLDLEMTAAGEHGHTVSVVAFQQTGFFNGGPAAIVGGFKNTVSITGDPGVNPSAQVLESGITSLAANHDHQITTNTTELGGGAESRPINMNFFIYIRID